MRIKRTKLANVKVGADMSEDPPMYLVKYGTDLDIGQFYIRDEKMQFVPNAGIDYSFLPDEIYEIIDEE